MLARRWKLEADRAQVPRALTLVRLRRTAEPPEAAPFQTGPPKADWTLLDTFRHFSEVSNLALRIDIAEITGYSGLGRKCNVSKGVK